MTRCAAILVSTGGAAFSDPSLFQQILAQAGSNADEVYLVVGDSLNRWNLLPVYHDMDVSLRKAMEGGDRWCAAFLEVTKKYLGARFKGVFRWEEWRTAPQIGYEQKRKEFDGFCNKQTVIDLLRGMLEKHTIISIEDFVAKSEVLKKEKGFLLSEKDWQKLSWENAITATILEYSIRHFQSTSPDAVSSPKSSFADFLITHFFPSAYEHQIEEAVMLYRCLIPANIRFDVLYYPNKIAPIFQKAHIAFAKPENLMFWNELKIDSKKEDDIERVIRMYFAGVQGMSRGDKEMLANLIRPLLAFVTTHKQQDQSTLFMTVAGLCNVFPQFVVAANGKKGYSPTLFAGAASSSVSDGDKDELYDRVGLSIVHSPPPAPNATPKVEEVYTNKVNTF